MRAIARTLVLAAAAGGFCGCKSSSSGGSSWNPFAKSKTPDPVMSNVPGPQLPSTATAGLAPPFNGASVAGGTAQGGAAAAHPYGNAAAGTAGSFAGASAGNAYPERPASATGAYPDTGYPPQNIPISTTAAAPAGGAAAGSFAQQGPYDGNYPNQGNARSTRWAESPADSPRDTGSAAGRFAAQPGMDGSGGYKSGSKYDTPAESTAAETRSSRWSGGDDVRGGARADVASSDSAGSNVNASVPPAGADSARDEIRTARNNKEFRPGDTGYEPGHNGYSPPGAAPYESPYKKNVAPGGYERREPFYRPGGTSDFVPTDTRRAATGAAGGPIARTANAADGRPAAGDRPANDARANFYDRAAAETRTNVYDRGTADTRGSVFDRGSSDARNVADDRAPAADPRTNGYNRAAADERAGGYDRPAYADGTVGPSAGQGGSSTRSGSWPVDR